MSLDFKYALPDVLNYAESKPNNIGSYTEISVVTPATGSGKVTVGDYCIVNIMSSLSFYLYRYNIIFIIS